MINTNCVTTVFDSDLGWVGLQWIDNRLLRSTFGHSDPNAALSCLPVSDEPVERLGRAQRDLVTRVKRYASGREVAFSDVLLDTDGFTPFQLSVLDACRTVAWGQTLSYGDLAAHVGAPRAARAVGTVMSKNRYPIVVPCHRITAAGSRPGGFTAPGGVSMKERMLRMEGWGSK